MGAAAAVSDGIKRNRSSGPLAQIERMDEPNTAADGYDLNGSEAHDDFFYDESFLRDEEERQERSDSMPMTTSLFPGRFETRAKSRAAHRSASMPFVSMPLSPGGSAAAMAGGITENPPPVPRMTLLGRGVSIDDALAGATERFRRWEPMNETNPAADGTTTGELPPGGRMARRASTGAVVDHMHFKPHPAMVKLSPGKSIPTRGLLKDQAKALEVRLVKNKKLRLAELERGSAAQEKEIQSLRGKIEMARRAVVERRNLDAMNRTKRDLKNAWLKQNVREKERRLVVLDNAIERAAAGADDLRTRLDGANATLRTTTVSRAAEAASLEHKTARAERGRIALRVRKRMAFQNTGRVAAALHDNMLDCDSCSDAGGEIAMEVTMQCRTMEKMTRALKAEMRRMLENACADKEEAVDKTRVRQLNALINRTENILLGCSALVDDTKALLSAADRKNKGGRNEERTWEDEADAGEDGRLKAEVAQRHAVLSRKREEIHSVYDGLVEKNRELNALRKGLVDAKEDRASCTASHLSLMRAMRARVCDLISRVREEERRAVDLRRSIAGREMSISSLRAEVEVIKSAAMLCGGESPLQSRRGSCDSMPDIPVDNSFATVYI
uniref:Uncharacterized protein n=1 Tax=Odontella aurita TaxID=265563 RepID=A0A7S4J326_9STRA